MPRLPKSLKKHPKHFLESGVSGAAGPLAETGVKADVQVGGGDVPVSRGDAGRDACMEHFLCAGLCRALSDASSSACLPSGVASCPRSPVQSPHGDDVACHPQNPLPLRWLRLQWA